MSFGETEPPTKPHRAPRTFEELWERIEESNKARDKIQKDMFTEIMRIGKALSEIQISLKGK